jgi:hypothetical protein
MNVVQEEQAPIALLTGFLDGCKGFIALSQRRSHARNDPTHSLASRIGSPGDADEALAADWTAFRT